jgi:hypothetical protein
MSKAEMLFLVTCEKERNNFGQGLTFLSYLLLRHNILLMSCEIWPLIVDENCDFEC